MQNADTLENFNSGLIHTFSKPNASIHGVSSVFSFHAIFAFQNCLLGCAETKGQTCFRKIEVIHAWHIESSVAQKKKEILWTSVIQALGRQCFQMCAVKNSISPGYYGLLEFFKT